MPLAPVAKDLISSLQAAVGAVQTSPRGIRRGDLFPQFPLGRCRRRGDRSLSTRRRRHDRSAIAQRRALGTSAVDLGRTQHPLRDPWLQRELRKRVRERWGGSAITSRCRRPNLFIGMLWPGGFLDSGDRLPLRGRCRDRLRPAPGAVLQHLGLLARQSFSFASHSLGVRFVLEAMMAINGRIDTACIAAGAVNRDCLTAEYAAVLRRVGDRVAAVVA